MEISSDRTWWCCLQPEKAKSLKNLKFVVACTKRNGGGVGAYSCFYWLVKWFPHSLFSLPPAPNRALFWTCTPKTKRKSSFKIFNLWSLDGMNSLPCGRGQSLVRRYLPLPWSSVRHLFRFSFCTCSCLQPKRKIFKQF